MRPGVIITGGAKRIGAVLARHFAKQGYDIALHYQQSKAEAIALQKEIITFGVECEIFSLDLTDTKAIPAWMERIHNTMPQCTALINNASVFERATLMETDEALFDRQMALHSKAPFFLTQSFARCFGNGAVINILDTDIAQTQGSHFAYLLSKKSLAEFTQMAARELGSKIRVNGVCPGYVLPHSEADAAYIREVEKILPLNEHATPDEIADTVLWLCRQKHVTGQILYIDGGKHVL